MDQKNKINDLEAILATLEAILLSLLWYMEPQIMEQMPKKKCVYNEERYEQNKEVILKYRRERYRTIHRKVLSINVSTGTFTLYFD